jgi:tRNA 2-thiouridine synthesizing protein A
MNSFGEMTSDLQAPVGRATSMDKDEAPSARLDAIGLKCPLPVLKTRAALRPLRSGAVLLVEADDPLAMIDIPHFVAQSGHELLEQIRCAGVSQFLIRKRSA